MDGLGNSATLYRQHLREQAFDALGRAASKVAFADLGSHQFARTGHAKALCSCLMRLDFILSIRLLTCHKKSPFTQNTADLALIRGWYTNEPLSVAQRYKIISS
jgi:hypothetical protein